VGVNLVRAAVSNANPAQAVAVNVSLPVRAAAQSVLASVSFPPLAAVPVKKLKRKRILNLNLHPAPAPITTLGSRISHVLTPSAPK
jgi:hypothetical protein